MTADPLPTPAAEPVPSWLIPPPGGFTVEHFLQLRGLPKHTELIDGSLVFVSPQQMWHSQIVNLLLNELDRQAPEHLRAAREMAVKLGRRQMPEPDVVVVTAAAHDRDQSFTFFEVHDVVLAVEAVSPDSEERDRDTKPHKYAAAGIPHFWRVEHENDTTTVYSYELVQATRTYVATGIHHNRLRLAVPFPIEIDLTAVGRKPR